jgi:hypothetical protein
MFAYRHALFVSAEAPQGAPRLFSVFDSALEAEREAAHLSARGLHSVLAGPEQPPAELGWFVATSVRSQDQMFYIESSLGAACTLNPASVDRVSLLTWERDNGLREKAMLLRLSDGKPVMFRITPTVDAHTFDEVREAVLAEGSAELQHRARSLSERDFQGVMLEGDVLPLMLAVMDTLDTHQVPRSGSIRRRPPPPTAAFSSCGKVSKGAAWILYGVSLWALTLAVGYFTIALFTMGVLGTLIGLTMSAWGTRRFMWSRWLAQVCWATKSPIPAFPILATEVGLQPTAMELTLDGALLTLLLCGTLVGEGAIQALSAVAFPVVFLAALSSTVAVYEAQSPELNGSTRDDRPQ